MSSQAKRGGSGGKGPRVGHLDSLTGILREMGCVYREMRYNQTPISDGAKLVFALGQMRNVLEALAVERLEERLMTVEERLEARIEAHHEARLN